MKNGTIMAWPNEIVLLLKLGKYTLLPYRLSLRIITLNIGVFFDYVDIWRFVLTTV